MLPPVRIEPKASDFNTLHVTVWANSLFAGSIKAIRLKAAKVPSCIVHNDTLS